MAKIKLPPKRKARKPIAKPFVIVHLVRVNRTMRRKKRGKEEYYPSPTGATDVFVIAPTLQEGLDDIEENRYGLKGHGLQVVGMYRTIPIGEQLFSHVSQEFGTIGMPIGPPSRGCYEHCCWVYAPCNNKKGIPDAQRDPGEEEANSQHTEGDHRGVPHQLELEAA